MAVGIMLTPHVPETRNYVLAFWERAYNSVLEVLVAERLAHFGTALALVGALAAAQLSRRRAAYILARRLISRTHIAPPQPAPRYDEVFHKGTAWLNGDEPCDNCGAEVGEPCRPDCSRGQP